MTTQPVYSLTDLANVPANQVGNWAKLLGSLFQQKVSITGGFVIPITTLHSIAQTNRLAERVASQPDSKVTQLFTKQNIESKVGHAWLKAFYHHIGDHPAYISTSWTQPNQPTLYRSGVKGDASVLESILELWAEAYLSYVKTQPHNPSLYPAAIVVQAQPKPEAYGIVQTNLGQAHYKAVVLVQASRRPLAQTPKLDEYKVDVRTWHVIESQPAAAESPVLDNHQVVLAAQAGYFAKLHQFDHGQLEWTMNHLHITPTKYETELTVPYRIASQIHLRGLLGTGVIPGIIRGQTMIVEKNVPRILKPDTILVARTLTHIPPTTLKYLSGLIIESTLPPTVLTQLQTFHIPTLINVKGALRSLKSGQSITLDAAHGQVIQPEQVQTSSSTLRTKLIIETSEGLTAQLTKLHPTDILFKPDQTLLQLGSHPLHYIRGKNRATLVQALSQKLQSFRSIPHLIYQTTNLTTTDLLSLKYGSQFEVPERNSDLGYRGTLRSLSQPELLDLELEVVLQAHRTSHQKMTILVTGVRSPSEYKLVAQHIQAKTDNSSWLSLWLEVSTPAAAIEFATYQHLSPEGIVANLPQLHALSQGIDPQNQDIYRLYPWDTQLLMHLLKHVMKEAGQVPVMAICPSDHPDLLKAVIELGVAGVIVKPYYVSTAKEYMMR